MFLNKKINALIKYYRTYKCVLSNKNNILNWSNNEHVVDNWGDALNPVLFKYLSGNEPIHYHNILKKQLIKYDIPIYTMIGSFLGNVRDVNSEVYGTGFMNYDSELQISPRAIHAVRGKLTRKKLIESGLQCPETFGDAALLFPMFYQPKVKINYKLGIIAQHRDHGSPLINKFIDSEVLSINIKGGLEKVVDQICMCEKIVSSSLHGIIAADSYGVPSSWIKFTGRVLGDGFKFHDYFSSVGTQLKEPYQVTKSTSIEDLLNTFSGDKPYLDIEKLLHSCPFLSKEVKSTLNSDLVFNRK